MRIHLSAAVGVLCTMLAVQTPLWGQLTSSSGMFGSRTLGGGSRAGARTFGGGSGLGTPSTTGGTLSTLAAGMGQITGSESFVRGNQQRGAFVGTSSAEMQGFAGSVQAGQNASRQAGSGLQSGSGLRSDSGLSPRGQNRGGRPNQGGVGAGTGRGGRRTSMQFRTALRVGFRHPVAAPSAVSAALGRRLSKSRRVQAIGPVEVVIQGRTATLRGVVATHYDRALAEQLARLEVGIWQVRNELAVAVAPDGPEAPVPDEPVEQSAAPSLIAP